MTLGVYTYDHTDDSRSAAMTLLFRTLKLSTGVLMLFLNQRWACLEDPDCCCSGFFAWNYLGELPELAGYTLSLLLNFIAAWLVLRGLFTEQKTIQ